MGLFSGIKKVFKKVAKVVVDVAPIALAAGAIIFSGGAALGLAPLGIAGGWGAAASSLIGATGLTGGAASILTAGLTNAGFGAAIGGLTSMIGGGSFTGGAKVGALAGGVTGLATGGFNAALQGGSIASPNPATANPMAGRVAATSDPLRATVQEAINAPSAAVSGPATPVQSSPLPAPLPNPANAAAANPTGGFIDMLGGKEVAGRVIGGAAQGFIAGLGADDEYKYLRERDRERAERFVLPEGGYDPGGRTANTSRFQTPARKYSRTDRPSFVARRYEFNPETGKIDVRERT